MEEIFRNVMEVVDDPLNGQDLLTLCDGKANLIKYNELERYSSIEELMGRYGAVIILYEWDHNMGHWTCCFKSLSFDKRIEFFDPYGFKPDEEKKFIPKEFWKDSFLTKLLLNAKLRNWEIEFNNYKFQDERFPSIATCGRWVGARLLLRNIDLEKFKQLFFTKEQFHNDFTITFFTFLLLGK